MLMPYFVMTVLFATLAALAALDASLASYGLVTWFNGLRWLRAHFITLGVLLEAVFGMLPFVIAGSANSSRPKMRWGVWLLLNGGLIVLLIGIPLINAALIIVGGTLIFAAVLLLIAELRTPLHTIFAAAESGRKFYMAALLYLLLGIFLGTGMWLGWGRVLGISNVKEIHVHANLWGFAALTFAGLIADLYPHFAGRSLASARANNITFWSMTVGALGLIVGPWIQSELMSTAGLLIHTLGSVILLINVIAPLIGIRAAWSAGMWHLLTAYIWFLIPSTIAPLMVLRVPSFPVAEIESNGGPILIYGWALQIGYALLPFVFARVLTPKVEARLGGNLFTLMAIHTGGILYWLGLFLGEYQIILHGTAFGLWAVSLLPIIWTLWRIVRAGLINVENHTIFSL